MKINLTKGLLINFIAVILISLITTGIISSYMIDSKFDVFLFKEHEERISNIKSMINASLEKNLLNPDFEGEGLTKYAILENYFIEIRDVNNSIIYTTGKSHLVHDQMTGKMMTPMMGWQSMGDINDFQEDSYTIEIGGQAYGKVIIGYFGISNISTEALTFKFTLYQSILMSSIIAILLATIISFIVSKLLGVSIRKITSAAKEIAKGNLSFRIHNKTKILEIHQLSESINHLASTLQEQESLRKRLTSDMAHEIRTPLTTIKSHIEAFMDGIWQPTSDRFEDCYEEINRLTSLVQNIEDINKLKKSNYILNKTVFNFGDELKKIIDSIRPQFMKKNLTVNFSNDSDLEVLIDRDKLRQIMYNLLSNAYKYSLQDGLVNVRSYVDDDNMIIEVQDFGVGIKDKDLPHVFEHLYRGDTSRTRETGGSGIGLSVTKALIEAHNGSIIVESTKEKGTIFTVYLPLQNN